MGRKKKFIDKKKAATFALLYRESGDGEEIGAERVYTRVDGNAGISASGFEEDDDSRFDDADEEEELEMDMGALVHMAIEQQQQQQQALPHNVRRELLEMGFPDDGYNYMKHMRTIGGGGGSSVFVSTTDRSNILPADFKAYDASNVQVKDALTDEAAGNTTNLRQIRSAVVKVGGLDREVAAVLEESDLSDDDGVDDSDGLEDDFVLVANQGVEEQNEPEPSSRRVSPSKLVEPVEEDEVRSFAALSITDERATGIVDQQFEVLAVKEYDCDVNDFGDDDPRAKGHAHMSDFTSIFDEFLAENPSFVSKPVVLKMQTERSEEPAREKPEVISDAEDEEEKEELETVWVDESDDEKTEKWDCETIVSTMSNLDNHPSRIGAPRSKGVEFASICQAKQQQQQTVIRLGGRQKLPLDFLPAKTKSEETKVPSQQKRTAAVRHSGESEEERKARKAAVKDERRASRSAKKELKTRFKIESQRAQFGAAVAAPPALHL